MDRRDAHGVLITGVYGSGKSSVAAEIAYMLEQLGEPYALLDLDYLGWAGTGRNDRAGELGLMLQNLAAVASNYLKAGIRERPCGWVGAGHAVAGSGAPGGWTAYA